MQHSPSAPYVIVAPVGQHTPVVLSSPHSGRHYPARLLALSRLPAGALRALDDGPVDELVARGCAAGATLIAATYPRAVVDLNRAPRELDPEALVDPLTVPGLRLTVKARAGLGVVPTRLLGEPIYANRLEAAEYRWRMEEVYAPYHAELASLLRERQERFGASLLLDCHSMPTLPAQARGERPIDVALGDRYGRSCHSRLMEQAERILSSGGLRVARNRPYAGGHITEHYGRPEEGSHAIQLEFRRGLFMHETSHERHAGFAALQHLLGELIHGLGEAIQEIASMFRPAEADPARTDGAAALMSA